MPQFCRAEGTNQALPGIFKVFPFKRENFLLKCSGKAKPDCSLLCEHTERRELQGEGMG